MCSHNLNLGPATSFFSDLDKLFFRRSPPAHLLVEDLVVLDDRRDLRLGRVDHRLHELRLLLEVLGDLRARDAGLLLDRQHLLLEALAHLRAGPQVQKSGRTRPGARDDLRCETPEQDAVNVALHSRIAISTPFQGAALFTELCS